MDLANVHFLYSEFLFLPRVNSIRFINDCFIEKGLLAWLDNNIGKMSMNYLAFVQKENDLPNEYQNLSILNNHVKIHDFA